MTTAVVPSFQDMVDLIASEVQTTSPELTFRDGDVTMAFAHAQAAMFDSGIAYIARALRALYFGTATGSDLDTIIMDRLQLPREMGSQAFGALVFNRPSGNGGSIAEGAEFSLPLAADGSTQSYTTDSPISFSSGAIVNASIAATCTTYGTSGNRTGDSTPLTPNGALFDTTIIVTNPDGMAGGNPSETDEDYRRRAVAYWQTQLKATLSAIETGVRTVTGVAVASAKEDATTGLCTVFVSDSSGNSTAQMCYQVQRALESWRAAGVYIAVQGGSRATLDLTISIDEYSEGFDVAAATVQIQDAITTRCNLLRNDEDFTQDSIKAAIIMPFPQDITKVHIVSITINSAAREPTGDIAANGGLIRVNSVTVIDGNAP